MHKWYKRLLSVWLPVYLYGVCVAGKNSIAYVDGVARLDNKGNYFTEIRLQLPAAWPEYIEKNNICIAHLVVNLAVRQNEKLLLEDNWYWNPLEPDLLRPLEYNVRLPLEIENNCQVSVWIVDACCSNKTLILTDIYEKPAGNLTIDAAVKLGQSFQVWVADTTRKIIHTDSWTNKAGTYALHQDVYKRTSGTREAILNYTLVNQFSSSVQLHTGGQTLITDLQTDTLPPGHYRVLISLASAEGRLLAESYFQFEILPVLTAPEWMEAFLLQAHKILTDPNFTIGLASVAKPCRALYPEKPSAHILNRSAACLCFGLPEHQELKSIADDSIACWYYPTLGIELRFKKTGTAWHWQGSYVLDEK